MAGRHVRTFAIAGICAGFVLAGAAAEVVLLPRALPKTPEAGKGEPLRVMTQAQMEGLLAKVAKNLDSRLRDRLADAVLTESSRGGLDPLFVLALVSVESRFRISVESERGASGLMQLMPSTFAWIAGREPDIADDAAVMDDPVIDVRLAVRYFKWLEHRFHSRDEALMAYNAGPKRLMQYKKSGEIPDSLREYARRVMKEYQRFVRIQSGGSDPHATLAKTP
ncbi:MAG: lytic transglycosylase domain-containing protein [Myxococcales bacterium]